MLVLATVAGACGDDAVGLGSGVRVVSGAEQSDTVFASLPAPLVVEVRSGGESLPGVGVLFTSPGPDSGPRVQFRSLGRPVRSLEESTDSSGRASVEMDLVGPGAGTALVRIQVPELGLSEEVSFHVLPGRPVAIERLIVEDLGPAGVVPLGGSVTFTATLKDAHGNEFEGGVECSSDDATLVVTGDCRAYGAAFGPARLIVRHADLEVIRKIRVLPWAAYLFSAATGLQFATTDSVRSEVVGTYTLDQPAWSPGGDTVVVTVSGSLHYLVFEDGTHGELEELIPAFRASLGEFDPVFSPDGHWVYFAARVEDAGSELWRVRSDGSSPEPLPSSEGALPGVSPSPSPDGRHLVFATKPWPWTSHLRILDLETGAVQDLGVEGHTPTWSPTGEWIAYGSGSTLRLIRRDGIMGMEIDAPGLRPQRFAWSPEGRYLMYTVDINAGPHSRGPKEYHKVVEIESGVAARVPKMVQHPGLYWVVGAPAWRP